MMMADNILDNFNNVDTAKECLVSRIEMFIWACGKKISLMDKDFMCMQMDKSTKENFKMVRKQEEDLTFIKVEPVMKVNGKKTRKMGLAYSFTQTIRNMKEIG